MGEVSDYVLSKYLTTKLWQSVECSSTLGTEHKCALSASHAFLKPLKVISRTPMMEIP
jgi:hypothetical protein